MIKKKKIKFFSQFHVVGRRVMYYSTPEDRKSETLSQKFLPCIIIIIIDISFKDVVILLGIFAHRALQKSSQIKSIWFFHNFSYVFTSFPEDRAIKTYSREFLPVSFYSILLCSRNILILFNILGEIFYWMKPFLIILIIMYIYWSNTYIYIYIYI